MKSIREYIDSIYPAEDKTKHFMLGLYAFMLFGILFQPVVGLAASIILGILIEIYQKLAKSGTADLWDVIATACGGTVGYICSVL